MVFAATGQSALAVRGVFGDRLSPFGYGFAAYGVASTGFVLAGELIVPQEGKIVSALDFAHPALGSWFEDSFGKPTVAQDKAWPVLARGESLLLLAPTGSGKTLSAFLVALNHLMFSDDRTEGTRVVYISPLKALGTDIERNLRAPLAGVAARAAKNGQLHRIPTVGIRTGDTEPRERERMRRHPPDILITTPESLYLMLTSRVRETLRGVETVIVDEIHALSGSKRGAHLFLTLERLEALRNLESPPASTSVAVALKPMQRIGLSATQRPLAEIASLLGGFERGPAAPAVSETPPADEATPYRPRPVMVVDAGITKRFDLKVEVPVEDMTALKQTGSPGTDTESIWPSLEARILELVRAHRSTMVFTNSRALAEKLAQALNDRAGEELALAHHGSISKEKRAQIEDRLKCGKLPAIVATSSLELGIDIGAVDLVVQVEAPLSVASGIQRIGRAGHQVNEISRAVFFPKFRGDLLASASCAGQVLKGNVEPTRYPRNPLDVLSQQLVAMLVVESHTADAVYALVRRAAPFAALSRDVFDSVLDMLSGRYPSERFGELRPRIHWDRNSGELTARRGARMLAVSNVGTIVDRGLYGVFIDGTEPPARVGELDEEMVFESRPGDVFMLGASSWKITHVTHDRVLVVPAPGEPGRMPFWRGEKPGRPLEFGVAIGAMCRRLLAASELEALGVLETEYRLEPRAARNLLAYLREQDSVAACPTDKRVVVEAFVDEVGDWKVAVLSPFGGRVHAPWCTIVASKLEQELGMTVDSMWADDGMLFRLPEADKPPDLEWFFPPATVVQEFLIQHLGGTALFAAHFRQNASRALLLPRRRPGQRVPLWVQRRRSADLLAVASEFRDFPIILETYRECLQDVFDVNGLCDVLASVEQGKIRSRFVMSKTASPFAASLLFSYVGNFLYDQDAPLAERRAQALTLDHAQLQLLLGEPDLRSLLDEGIFDETNAELQRLCRFEARDKNDIHELLLRLGDLSEPELVQRVPVVQLQEWLRELKRSASAIEVTVASQRRWIAGEDAGKYRDALGCVLPPGLPDAFCVPQDAALLDLVLRFARSRAPFLLWEVSQRFGLGEAVALTALRELEKQGLVLEGAFTPQAVLERKAASGSSAEWCHREVLQRIKARSLAKLRREVEPVGSAALSRFLVDWHGLADPVAGRDALLSCVETLQGASLWFSAVETQMLPARLKGFHPRELDALASDGEIVWRGLAPADGDELAGDGKIAIYLASDYPLIAQPVEPVEGELAQRLRSYLECSGAVFFESIAEHIGGFVPELTRVLWQMVWAGEVSNDTFAPLRSLGAGAGGARRMARPRPRGLRGRLPGAVSGALRRPGTEGRWFLLPELAEQEPMAHLHLLTEQLLLRNGVVTREAVRSEGIIGGFSRVYAALKAREQAGKVRRGYFVQGLGGAQFALPGADVRLRAKREPESRARVYVVAACDPANIYGALVGWPKHASAKPQRARGARVILWQGRLVAYLSKSSTALSVYSKEVEPTVFDSRATRLAANASSMTEALLLGLDAILATHNERALLIKTINSQPAIDTAWGALLCRHGFSDGARGLMKRKGSYAGG